MVVRSYRIRGIVQGVGFRPFVHRLASQYQLKGWILNDSDGVLLEVEGKKDDINKFISDINEKHPTIAKVDSIEEIETDSKVGLYKDFVIRNSVQKEETKTLIPPDTFVCKDCIKELFDKNNRRYHYPFINCTNCGPRYTIIEEMPYDRVGTTMKKFEMCPQCKREYEDINNRRYHAQPNACPVCGPQLELLNKVGEKVEIEDIVDFCKEQLLEGKILAVKSIGGFHLVANALDDVTVKRLRALKKRDSKPFALMMNDVNTVKKYMEVSEAEADILASYQRPIVLLKKKGNLLPNSIAPNNPSFGVMLPSAPLHYLLLDDEKIDALIMTSGNISGEPIVFKNDHALDKLHPIADYFLINNRDIHIRVDDSIVRCVKGNVGTLVRRARGFAPYPIKVSKKLNRIFAFGSELKSTIALSKENEVFISQHIGDVKNDEIFNSLLKCKNHLEKLLSIEPNAVVCDLHPSFRSSNYARQQEDLPVIQVQHHHAHMASCMAENNLDEKVIGVILDGTGYGMDGTIWGGEFLLGDYKEFKRVGKLRGLFLLGGDKAVKEPIRIGFNILYEVFKEKMFDYDLPIYKHLSDQEKKVYYRMSEKKINAFETSSMGRLFDGISAILGICHKIEYEGQAAIELEGILNREFDILNPFNYEIVEESEMYILDYKPIIVEIVNLLISNKENISTISRKFHSTIADAIGKIVKKISVKTGVSSVVLSGGVFMNEYLLTNAISKLENEGFKVYFHKQVPTNDGGISLGQIMIANSNMEEY